MQPSRPAIPRSVSSTSYLNKHRRSPSITSNHSGSNGHVVTSSMSRHGRGSSASGSLRPSPSPVNDLLIPSGAVATPPDSSDDDEERGRAIGDIKELQEALKNFELKRGPSPTREEPEDGQEDSIAPSVRPGGLTPEARKISHSRSASEITLSQHGVQLDSGPVISSTEGSDAEDDELRIKPPLLRKKSGELVRPALRPSSARRRPSSMPGTPTYSKVVHFNESLEQVRHFSRSERPMAVSAGSSPVETYDDDSEYPFSYDDGYRSKVVEWEIRLSNFPTDTYERKTAPVRVERIFLSSDHKTLVGTVAVANIAFHKAVVARFTLDYWKTTSEVTADYNHDVRKKLSNDGYDRFNFNIKLADQANLESKTLLLCVRYSVNGQEFWDNNNSMNYQVDFVKKVQPKSKKSSGPSGAIPRSRHSPPATRPRSMPAGSFDDDFSHSLDARFQFGSGPFLGDSLNPTIRLKPKPKRGSIYPDQKASNKPSAHFSIRYDFGASLSAALSNAQTATGKPIAKTVQQNNAVKPASPKPNMGATPVPGTGSSSEKPDLQSAEYHELIQKFCFVRVPAPGINGLDGH